MWKLKTPEREAIFKFLDAALAVAVEEKGELIATIKMNKYSTNKSNYQTWEVAYLLDNDSSKLVKEHADNYHTKTSFVFEVNVHEVREKYGMTDESHPKPE
tara:strand:- start:147 stop:449 length:303 start_codon:yes stop_codon:yes gene_type:complete